MAEQIITKTCYDCKETKPITKYYIDNSKKGGYMNICKICNLKRSKKYRQTEKGKASNRKSQRIYKKSGKGKANDKRYRQSEKGKLTIKISDRNYRARYPERTKAKWAARQAIIEGKIKPLPQSQCYYCGGQSKMYHHWHGYEPEHWLDVIPVCRKCHSHQHNQAITL